MHQIRISASQMVAMPYSGCGLTLTQTALSSLSYSIGLLRLRLESEKNGRSIIVRSSFGA